MQTAGCDEVAAAYDAAVERQALRWTRSQSILFSWLRCDRPRDKHMPPARFLLAAYIHTLTCSGARARVGAGAEQSGK
jgi:hypothetical protein